jgi:hypothetical protein
MNVSVGSVLHDNRALRAALKGMRKSAPPPALITSLRILASWERQRAAERRSLASFYGAWADRARLAMQNLMRPLALPFAGGVFSAVALFSLWVAPAYPVLAHGGADVPTGLSTSAAVKFTSPIGMSNADIVVDVLVDEQGRMVEYSVLSGTLDARSRRNLENALMFTEFVPATAFGRPGLGRVRVWLNSSRIDVKG